MPLVKGIQSSKRRLATLQRAQARDNARRKVLAEDNPMPGHGPSVQHPDGTFSCRGCTDPTRFSPAMLARHLAGRPNLYFEHGVYVTGAFDEWLLQRERQPEVKQSQADREAEALRSEQVAMYYDKNRRSKPRVVDGADRWMTD